MHTPAARRVARMAMRSILAFGRTWDIVVERREARLGIIVEQHGKRVLDRTIEKKAPATDIVLHKSEKMRLTARWNPETSVQAPGFPVTQKNPKKLTDFGEGFQGFTNCRCAIYARSMRSPTGRDARILPARPPPHCNSCR